MEGQYQVEFGHALARESLKGNISRMLPLRDPVIIRNKNHVGDYNPNMENKTLSLICKYVQCFSVEKNCSTTVRPLGHCCDICGTVMTFASNKFTVKSISELVQDVIADKNLNDLVQYSIDRIDEEDDDEVTPRYQIVGFPLKEYDDTVFATFTTALHNKLTSSRANLMEYFSSEYKWSQLDHSYTAASKIAGLVTFCLLVLIALAVSLRSNMNEDRNASSIFQVAWHQGNEDDDVVQLLDPTEDITSEEEEGSAAPLPVETLKPRLFRVDKYNVTTNKVVEGLAGVEMQLIQ
ncbi:hypothetical protein KIN20_025378 [Parelaphostrongylus tenuis]|uniref:Protein amnionless n=1 Tax=Parelaphostrongylus tenuis TaxID=148309 RepID=A0AAD5NBU0_PARTN|nr:hypothetical protein KIN20_025378 [Parelaphostrongylus tenuis]